MLIRSGPCLRIWSETNKMAYLTEVEPSSRASTAIFPTGATSKAPLNRLPENWLY